MNQKIIGIRQSYDNGTLRDGVVVIIEKEGKTVEHSISGTEWSTRCAEESFEVGGVQLTEEHIKKINDLFYA